MISKKDCARVVDSFLDAVKGALQEQHNIEVRGFGTFKIRVFQHAPQPTDEASTPEVAAPKKDCSRPAGA